MAGPLNQAKKDTVFVASKLGDYQKISITDLANGYCIAKGYIDSTVETVNKEKAESYMAALILRWWYKIGELYRKTITANAGLDYEDFYTKLYERIDYACRYHAWTDPDKHSSAQACINQAISTEVKNMFYFSNLDKNKANVNTYRLDAPMDEDDEKESFMNTLVEPKSTSDDFDAACFANDFVQYHINNKKIVEAIILDQIAFNDTSKVKKTSKRVYSAILGKEHKVTEYSTEFWAKACIDLLRSLPDDFESKFRARYRVKADELACAVSAIRTAKNPKLYRYLRATLAKAKTELLAFNQA